MEIDLKNAALVACGSLEPGAGFVSTPSSWGWTGFGIRCADYGKFSSALGGNRGIPHVRAWETTVRGGGLRVVPIQLGELSLELGACSGASAAGRPGQLLINADGAFLTVVSFDPRYDASDVGYLNLRSWEVLDNPPDTPAFAFDDWKLIGRRGGDQKIVLFEPAG